MKTTLWIRFYLATAVLALALASGGCATTAPRVERYTPPPLGSTFTYSQTDTGSYGSGTIKSTSKIIEHTWEGKKVMAFASPIVTILLNENGTWPAWLAPGDKPTITWDPPIGYDFPLEVGKTWTKSYRLTMHATQQTVPFDTTWKIESYEDAKVAAGNFKVFKISYSDTIGNEDTQWYCPTLGCFIRNSQKRTVKFPGGPGTREIELISYTIKK
jgi:hypothetical protein